MTAAAAPVQPQFPEVVSAHWIENAWGPLPAPGRRQQAVALEPLKELFTYLSEQWKLRDRHDVARDEESRRNRDALVRWSSDHAHETLFQAGSEIDAAKVEAARIIKEAQREGDQYLARTETLCQRREAETNRRVEAMYAEAQDALDRVPAPEVYVEPDTMSARLAREIDQEWEQIDGARQEVNARVTAFRDYLTGVVEAAGSKLKRLPPAPDSTDEAAALGPDASWLPGENGERIATPSLDDHAPVLEFPDRTTEEPPDGAA